MKRLIIFLFLIPSLFVFSQDKPLISILDFASTGLSAMELRLITDYMSNHIVKTGLYQVIDSRERDLILSELKFSLSGCVDEACQLEVGRLLQAKEIIVGSIGLIASKFLLNIKLLNVETGATVVTSSAQYNSIEELINDSKNFIYNFFLDEDAPYSFKQSELNIQHINKMLEGYDPQRFQNWLKEKDFEQAYIVGDGFIKNDYIKTYKEQELGLRFSLNLDTGLLYRNYDQSKAWELQTGIIASFQPFRRINFGFIYHLPIHNNIRHALVKDDNIRHYLAEFLNIGSYIAFGNKITDAAFGFGIKFEYILNGELNLLLLGYLKGFHIKLSGIYSLTNPDYYSLGVSGGFLVF